MWEIALGIWQARIFPRNTINVFYADGVLFDSGARWHGAKLFRQIEQLPLEWIALTHAHPDHIGSAAKLRRLLGCPVVCHERDAKTVSGVTLPIPQHILMNASRWIFGGPPCHVDRELREGDLVGGFRVIHAPGHTPGHVIYFRERDRLAIAGDILFGLNPLTLRPDLREPPALFTVDPEENRRSIAKLIALSPSVLLLGHGPPRQGPSLLRDLADVLERSATVAAASPAIDSV